MSISNSVIGAATFLLGVGALASGLSGCSISPPSAAAETEEIYVRLFHIAPLTQSMSLIAGEEKEGGFSSTLNFRMLTPYRMMTAGQYEVGVALQNRGVGNSALSNLDLAAASYVNLSGGKYFTVLAMGEPSRMSVEVLADDYPARFDSAGVRFVHGVPDIDRIQWTSAQTLLVPSLGYEQASSYVWLDPGFHTLQLREVNFPEEIPREAETADPEPLQLGRLLDEYHLEFGAGELYTIYTTGLSRGEPEMDIVMTTQAKLN